MRNRIQKSAEAQAAPGDGNAVRSVERALTLIELLAEERRSLGIADLVQLTSLPQATVHRLLAALIEHGWVERSRYTSRYKLGPGILGTTAVALAHAPLLERGRPVLAEVAARFGLDAFLSVLVGRRVAFLERATIADRPEEFHPGITQPAHCTAAGKVLLAFLSPGQRQKLLLEDPRPLRRYTARTVTELDRLQAELDAIRANGSANDDGEFKDTWRSVAVPVFGATGDVIAALSCGGSPRKLAGEKPQLIRAELLVVADELSRQLGLQES